MSRNLATNLRRWVLNSATTGIIAANVLVWIVCEVSYWVVRASIGSDGAELALYEWLALPGSWTGIAARPWTILTYMFTQFSLLHLVANMLWFYLFGQILELELGWRRLILVYVAGGIVGALTFILASPGLWLVGASCSVLAVAGALLVRNPKMQVNLFIFGRVAIYWIIIIAVVFFVVFSESLLSGAVHLAGFVFGAVFALITRPSTRIRVAESRVGTLKRFENHKITIAEEEEFDRLLEKVSRSGYGSLSASERQRLFDLSQLYKQQ